MVDFTRVSVVSKVPDGWSWIKKLKAENTRLREDVAILRAATSFFVGELDPRNR